MRDWRRIVFPLLVVAACGDDSPPAMPTDAGGNSDAGPPSIEITTYTGFERRPLDFVAAQDGDGPWQLLTSDDGVYSLDVASGRYGVAHVCGRETLYPGVYFRYSTVEEESHQAIGCTGGAPPSGSIHTVVNGLGAEQTAEVWVDGTSQTITVDSPGSPIDRPPGTYDVFVTLRSADAIDGFIIERGLSVSPDTTSEVVVSVDDGVAPESFAYALTGGSDQETLSAGVAFLSRNATYPPLSLTPGTYAAVPESIEQPDEMHWAGGSANDADAETFRAIDQFFHTGRDVSLELPALPGPHEVTAGGSPLRARISLQMNADGRIYAARWIGPMSAVWWQATRGWLGVGPDVSWEQPDLSDLAGWSDEWLLEDGEALGWDVTEMTGEIDERAIAQLSPLSCCVLPLHFPIGMELNPSADWDGKGGTLAQHRGTFTP